MNKLLPNKLTFLALIIANTFAIKGQTIFTHAGNGTPGFSGDGGAATVAQVRPYRVASDASGNIYIVDFNRIRKVDNLGTITTIAGTGIAGFSGDSGPATLAQLDTPEDVAVDASGNIYILDVNNYRVRKINSVGTITTVAGNGTAGFSGDGGPATSAQINTSWGIAIDGSGNIYISDSQNHRIRKVSSTGTMTTIAGNGTGGYSGDGGLATSAQVNYPQGLVVDASGNLLIADLGNYRIRKISTTGTITTAVGNGSAGFSGDGGAATSAQINGAVGIALDVSGNIYFADQAPSNRIRKVTTSGIINTIAGTIVSGYSGDGGPATSAQLNQPEGVAVDGSGNVYIADVANYRVRVICINNCLASINEQSTLIQNVLIYPNPNNGIFKLKTDIENGEITLYNSVGQKVHEQKITQGTNNINADRLAHGLYHYVLKNNLQTKSGNVIVE